MKYLASLFLSLFLHHHILPAQFLDKIYFFPETTYVSPFSADAHAHRMEVENILLTRNVRASLGGMFPIVNVDLFGTISQASFGASAHFELRPIGQGQMVSNDYYVDFIVLDIPLGKHFFGRFVSGHTSHHLSDNWYQRLNLTTSLRYSRDYLKLFFIYEKNPNEQFYLGTDYGYIFTIGRRFHKPWIFQTGGKIAFGELFQRFTLYGAVDSKIRQEADFAATNTLQLGISLPMQRNRILRISFQYRRGLDERGQFYPQHREMSTIGLSIE